MNFLEIVNSRLGIALGLIFSRLPVSLGYQVAQWAADRASSQRDSPGVQAIRANQWVVHGERLSAAELDCLVCNTFRNSARGLYEFWHFLPDKNSIIKMVKFDSSFVNLFDRENSKGKGLMLVLPHMVNFDLIGIAAALNGFKLHALSYPSPRGDYQWQNKLRMVDGLMITPMSVEALRLVSQTLSSGGVVVTGIERPLNVNQGKYPLRFFGKKAFLPVLHIRLALKHNVPLSVIGGRRTETGKYRVWASEPIHMKRNHDLIQETIENAEAILDIAEENIRQVPDQWAMYYPVWPEVMGKVPV